MDTVLGNLCIMYAGMYDSKESAKQNILPSREHHFTKLHTKLHPGLEWRSFNILTCEGIDDFTDIKFVS